MWENEWITAPSAIETPGPITTNGSIVTSLPKAGIGGEVHRLRRDHRHAGLERRLAQPRLHHLLGFGELGLGVDAAHFILAGFDHDGLQSQVPNDADRVGQIIFALAVGIADLFDDFERLAAVERHYAGIAERDRAFRGDGVGLLADRHQTVALDQQPAIAGGIGGAKAEHRQRRAVLQRRAQALECGGRNQRRIAERNQQIVRAAGDRIAGRQHRMRGAQTLALNEGRGIRPHPPGLFADSLLIGSDHHGERRPTPLRGGAQHMRQQRLAGHRMQHFRGRGAHARALAGREHDRQAGSCRSSESLSSGGGYRTAAVLIKRFCRHWKPEIRPQERFPGFKLEAHFLLMFAA